MLIWIGSRQGTSGHLCIAAFRMTCGTLDNPKVFITPSVAVQVLASINWQMNANDSRIWCCGQLWPRLLWQCFAWPLEEEYSKGWDPRISLHLKVQQRLTRLKSLAWHSWFLSSSVLWCEMMPAQGWSRLNHWYLVSSKIGRWPGTTWGRNRIQLNLASEHTTKLGIKRQSDSHAS